MYKYIITCVLDSGTKVKREVTEKNQTEALRAFFESLPKDYIEGSYSIIIQFVKKIS
jgi:hypothetical protein